MTPKEKAIELFEFYYQCGDCPKSWAKLNSLKVANELIMEIPELKWNGTELLQNNKFHYWKEVKQEIENL
jgi:hypothetical protein